MQTDLRIHLRGARHRVSDTDQSWDLVIPGGSFVAITGRRGSFAEHMLDIIAVGDVANDRSVITEDGAEIRARADRFRLISYLPEDTDTFLVNLYVDEEIGFYLENLVKPVNEILDRVTHVSRTFRITHLLSRKITSLSGGQRQLVAIASVICA